MRDFDALPEMLHRLADHWVYKILVGLIFAIWGFLFPSPRLMEMGGAVLGLIALDTVTGFMASVKTGVPIESGKAGRMLLKFGMYLVTVLLVRLAADTLPEGKAAHAFLLSIVLAGVAYTEIVSNSENLEKLGFPLPKKYRQWLRGRNKALNSAKDKV
jgi:phage-related holin